LRQAALVSATTSTQEARGNNAADHASRGRGACWHLCQDNPSLPGMSSSSSGHLLFQAPPLRHRSCALSADALHTSPSACRRFPCTDASEFVVGTRCRGAVMAVGRPSLGVPRPSSAAASRQTPSTALSRPASAAHPRARCPAVRARPSTAPASRSNADAESQQPSQAAADDVTTVNACSSRPCSAPRCTDSHLASIASKISQGTRQYRRGMQQGSTTDASVCGHKSVKTGQRPARNRCIAGPTSVAPFVFDFSSQEDDPKAVLRNGGGVALASKPKTKAQQSSNLFAFLVQHVANQHGHGKISAK